jgi:flagellar hook-basal body complex protein FliE
MPTDPIATINRIAPLAGPDKTDKLGQTASTPPFEHSADKFGQLLANAMNDLSQTDAAASQAIASLATGENVELHQVMMAMQEADIAMHLALQVRNKLVEAYQEIMRMQV